MITVIDYGIGNTRAFINIYERLHIPVKVASNIQDLQNAEKLILPGVGSFDFAMKNLEESGMKQTLNQLVLEAEIPVLGVCLGMQLMAESSEEGSCEGLGWIKGKVKKIDTEKVPHQSKLPHMGWNEVRFVKENALLNGLEKNSLFYFLHSYYIDCHEDNEILGISEFAGSFASAVNTGNIYGTQFHPEKSHSNGEKLLFNFAKL
ncbi:imidazole glycerol phosphate synthase subunit HisH [Chryseobacterium caseinilyticum]|uniref:Imidazole glycerol phosphate synthase subunit HisH n=1 Tax=Chryseobacterium caseinilyticum TaxID=2771428 RepID=A0ABR8ZC26_9FLAO|nr:imidazole glycerol phosphate synthase subunit HisH [Chryseobacterium caseinilyticum]MBD8082316.1 imidazole glycerol phosphate synthase subunit HisH [Chryseobacterium caseinilyticum]